MSVSREMIRDVQWFSGTHSIVGAVLIFSDPAGHKVYLGSVPASIADLSTPDADALYIANFGARVDRRFASALFPDIAGWAS